MTNVQVEATTIDIFNQEGLEFLKTIESDSIDLILTDPPYITSKETGMDKWAAHVKRQDLPGAPPAKTEEDWAKYVFIESKKDWNKFFENGKIVNRSDAISRMKKDFLKYGSIYGKKYAVTTDYGDWDSQFTIKILDKFVKEFYRVLREGASAIIFFDLWKITDLKKIMESSAQPKKTPIPKRRKKTETEEEFEQRRQSAIDNPVTTSGFKQIRFIEWIKTNPQPINSKCNYLTNCREIALLGVKGGSATFNSTYDNAIYRFPLQTGNSRFHPTQKSLPLFEALVEKHSNKGDTVLDPFAGSATTAIAAKNLGRNFVGCEVSEEFFKKSIERIENPESFKKKKSIEELDMKQIKKLLKKSVDILDQF